MEPDHHNVKLIIAGGGTGGHLFPGIAIARELESRPGDSEILFVAGRGRMDARILPEYGYPVAAIDVQGLMGRGKRKAGLVLVKLPLSLLQSMSIIRRFRPTLVLGMGGYSAGPVGLAAKMMGGIPLAVHEQNSFPGLTNRLLARLADRVFISFEQSRPYFKCEELVLTGTPVRKELFSAAKPTGGDSAFTILVTGGSQGAHAINRAFVEALTALKGRGKHPEVIHQTGEADCEEMRRTYEERGLQGEVVPFIGDMASAYARADLVVSRAGASTIFELAALGKASVLIPFPFAANRHQDTNARALVEGEAAEMIPQKDLTGDTLAEVLGRCMADYSRVSRMAERARRLGRRDAARVIVDQLLKLSGGGP